MYDKSNRSSVDGVYPRGNTSVNPAEHTTRVGRVHALATALTVLVATGVGCEPIRVQMSPYPEAAFYPVGIWYGVEPVCATWRGDPAERINMDLATVSRMGLNTVFCRHLDSGTLPAVTAAARRHHLKIVLPDRSAQYYVMTGKGEPRSSPAARLTDSSGTAAGVLCAVDIGRAADRKSAERLERVAASYRFDPALPSTFAQTTSSLPGSVAFLAAMPVSHASEPVPAQGRPAGRPMMTLLCDHRPRQSSADAVRRWIWRFHAGLARGLTGGLVIDQYHSIPGRGSALVDADGLVDVQRINTIRRIADRMRRWGSMLDRLDQRPFVATTGIGEELSLTLFSRNRRRLLLVFNRSESEYVKTTVTLDAYIGALPTQHMVEVPGDASMALGAVTKASRGRITLRLNIAPGDARLYELF